LHLETGSLQLACTYLLRNCVELFLKVYNTLACSTKLIQNSAKDSEESWGCIWKAPSWCATPQPWCTPLHSYHHWMSKVHWCDLVMSRLVLGVYHVLFILGFRYQDF
jgi:hypothetical protein